LRAFASPSTGAVPFHRDPTNPAHGCAGTLFRTPPLLPTGATVSRYAHSLQNRPTSASSFYGSNLTPADNAIGKVNNERRNFENFVGPTNSQKTPLANSR